MGLASWCGKIKEGSTAMRMRGQQQHLLTTLRFLFGDGFPKRLLGNKTKQQRDYYDYGGVLRSGRARLSKEDLHPRLAVDSFQASGTAVPQSRFGGHLGTGYIQAMSSDADYAAFLDKANQDMGTAEAKEASEKTSYGTKSVNTAVPSALKEVQEYYVSDSDEPFEPVALEYGGNSVSSGKKRVVAGTSQEQKLTVSDRGSSKGDWQRQGGRGHGDGVPGSVQEGD